mmetsp:Transcript_19042/g.43079  ORF Transcript_19042/g.43079 Transcript_19042/m.43079 type:complete len:96 (-) Transcript_19042:17-304(-)
MDEDDENAALSLPASSALRRVVILPREADCRACRRGDWGVNARTPSPHDDRSGAAAATNAATTRHMCEPIAFFFHGLDRMGEGKMDATTATRTLL